MATPEPTEIAVKGSAAPDWPRIGLTVGIGASAGGLAAFKAFLANMAPDTGRPAVPKRRRACVLLTQLGHLALPKLGIHLTGQPKANFGYVGDDRQAQ